MNKEIEEKIKKISKSWFYSNPFLFSVFCTHSLIQNDSLTIPFRTGKLRIEYSPLLTQKLSERQLEDYLKIEVYRILLGHPYSRQFYNSKKQILLLASDVTINQFYKTNISSEFINNDNTDVCLAGVDYLKNQAVRFGMLTHPLGIKWENSDELKFFQRNLQINKTTGALETLDDLTYEQWYKKLYFLISETAIAGSENAGSADQEKLNLAMEEASELWEENQEAQDLVKEQIQKSTNIDEENQEEGNLERYVQNVQDISFDYRRALSKFRQNIISSKRSLTRMKPSRRYGFKVMGSRYERKANLLIAVDVSGSISDVSFNNFCKAIKNIFFLKIIDKIEVLFFDVNLKNTTPIAFDKKIDINKIKGRGGTNFQPPVDYFIQNSSFYSGMIIFTDGEGNIPNVTGIKKDILWILNSRKNFIKNSDWIKQLQNSSVTYLPVLE